MHRSPAHLHTAPPRPACGDHRRPGRLDRSRRPAGRRRRRLRRLREARARAPAPPAAPCQPPPAFGNGGHSHDGPIWACSRIAIHLKPRPDRAAMGRSPQGPGPARPRCRRPQRAWCYGARAGARAGAGAGAGGPRRLWRARDLQGQGTVARCSARCAGRRSRMRPRGSGVRGAAGARLRVARLRNGGRGERGNVEAELGAAGCWEMACWE